MNQKTKQDNYASMLRMLELAGVEVTPAKIVQLRESIGNDVEENQSTELDFSDGTTDDQLCDDQCATVTLSKEILDALGLSSESSEEEILDAIKSLALGEEKDEDQSDFDGDFDQFDQFDDVEDEQPPAPPAPPSKPSFRESKRVTGRVLR